MPRVVCSDLHFFTLSLHSLFFTFSFLITQGWPVIVKEDIDYASISCITLSLPAITWICICCLIVWPRVDQKIGFKLYIPIQVVENPTGSGVSFWFQFCMYETILMYNLSWHYRPLQLSLQLTVQLYNRD